jgi:hypothetical protein
MEIVSLWNYSASAELRNDCIFLADLESKMAPGRFEMNEKDWRSHAPLAHFPARYHLPGGLRGGANQRGRHNRR